MRMTKVGDKPRFSRKLGKTMHVGDNSKSLRCLAVCVLGQVAFEHQPTVTVSSEWVHLDVGLWATLRATTSWE